MLLILVCQKTWYSLELCLDTADAACDGADLHDGFSYSGSVHAQFGSLKDASSLIILIFEFLFALNR